MSFIGRRSVVRLPESLSNVSVVWVVLAAHLLLAAPSTAQQITYNYYVSSLNGDDNDNGLTAQTAWATITRLNQQNLNPGDKVYLERGSLWTDATLVLSSDDSGSSSSPVTISPYGAGSALAPAIIAPNSHVYLNDSGWTQHSTYTNVYYRSFSFSARFICIRQTGGLFWPFIKTSSVAEVANTQGSCFFDSGTSTWYMHTPTSSDPRSDGVKYYVMQYLDARNAIEVSADYITITSINAAAGYIPIEITNNANHVIIDSCFATAANLGISTAGDNTRITGCTVKYVGDGVGSSSATDVTIDANTIVDGRPDIGEGEGIASGYTDNLYIHHNNVTDYRRLIIIIGYTQIDNLHISHNYLKSTQNGSLSGVLLSEGSYGFGEDISIHDNIIDLEDSACCTDIGLHLASNDGMWEPTSVMEIFNNTIRAPNGLITDDATSNGPYGIDCGSINFWNNLLICDGRNMWLGEATDSYVDYNLYQYSNKWTVDGSDYTSFVSYTSATGFDSNGLNATPTFCGSLPWKLNSTSPGVNDGVFRDPLEDVLDFYGTPHSDPPSIGAAEECSE